MRTWLWTWLVVCACGGAKRDPDCALVESEPATAAARLSEKYPGAPVKVAETIERCIAPTGATCERLGKIVAAIPSMMPAGSPAVSSPPDPVKVCEQAPPALQRCLFPSHALAHPDECAAAMREQLAAIEITPSHDRGVPPADACPELAIRVETDRIVIERGNQTTVAHAGGAIDATALEAALRERATECIGDTAVDGADAVVYQDLIDVMDVAMKAGFMNIGVETGDDGPRPPPPGGGGGLKDAPVIVITRDAVQIGGKAVAPLAGDVTAAVTTALPAGAARKAGLVILQADASVRLRTIKQAIVGARRAGYADVMFAVKNR